MVDKKRITRFLLKNNIEFHPVGNRKDEYETIIRMRTPSPVKNLLLKDKSCQSNIKNLLSIIEKGNKSMQTNRS